MPPQPPSPADAETRRHPTTHASPSELGVTLHVLQGPDAGREAALDASRSALLVGKGPACELRLTDPGVSRRHASLELTEHGVLLRDLDSTNGTFVGPARVLSAYVGPGVRLQVGSTILEVRPAAPQGTASRAPRAASLGRMASSSPRMINVLTLAARLARSDVPVVLEGETGTGKERLAECMHEASARAPGPFVVLDCRTTPAELIDPYLFGGVDAGTRRAGIFELASGGTLLLDEPGDLPAGIQAKLLRALDGTLVRVGDTTPVAVDVRVVTTTSRDLDRLVEEGRFREDLYHRLAGARLELPPLRRRREDIPLLGAEMWTELGGKGLLPDEVLQRFEGYDWPGNVRELERAIERFLLLGDTVSLVVSRTHRHVRHVAQPELRGAGEDALSRILAARLGYSEARQRMLEEFERAYLERALADAGGNVSAAAASSGIARRHFQRVRARQR